MSGDVQSKILDMDVDQQLVHKKTTVTQPQKSQPKGKQKAAGKRLEKIITGAQISDQDKPFIHSIFIYDIPTSWDAAKVLSELQEWGKPLDITVKRQKKYQTVVTIWSPYFTYLCSILYEDHIVTR